MSSSNLKSHSPLRTKKLSPKALPIRQRGWSWMLCVIKTTLVIRVWARGLPALAIQTGPRPEVSHTRILLRTSPANHRAIFLGGWGMCVTRVHSHRNGLVFVACQRTHFLSLSHTHTHTHTDKHTHTHTHIQRDRRVHTHRCTRTHRHVRPHNHTPQKIMCVDGSDANDITC